MNSEKEELRDLKLAEQARNAVSVYCEALDSGDLKPLADLLDPDIVLQVPPDTKISGKDIVVDWFFHAVSGSAKFRRHFNTNAQVDLMSVDEAEVRTYFLSLLDSGDGLIVAWGNFIFNVKGGEEGGVITRILLDIEMPPSPLKALLG